MAYAAKTGGSSIANGFLSNSQGEVEAWFDTPQTVDVRTTDNAGAAFYPFAPTPLLTFSNVTEGNWDLEPAREDHPTAVGTTGDLNDITAAAQTEEAGTSTRWSDADHIHGHVDISANPHGVGDHTDVTRTLMLRAEDATLGTGAAFLNVGAGLNISRTVEYSDAASEDATWTFVVPDDYISGAITVQPVWNPSATDAVAHKVRWNYTAKSMAAGSDVTAAGTAVAWNGANAARTVSILVYDTATSTTVTPAGAGEIFLLNVQRVGADAADDYVGIVRLHALLVTYTAHQ